MVIKKIHKAWKKDTGKENFYYCLEVWLKSVDFASDKKAPTILGFLPSIGNGFLLGICLVECSMPLCRH